MKRAIDFTASLSPASDGSHQPYNIPLHARTLEGIRGKLLTHLRGRKTVKVALKVSIVLTAPEEGISEEDLLLFLREAFRLEEGT
jgi:hypothetical protein